MEQYIPKSALVAEMKKKIELYIDTSVQLGFDKCCSVHYLRGRKEQCEEVISLLDTLEVKEVDLELIIGWFDHIAQIANDRKTLNGDIMDVWTAFDEIKCLAKNSSEFIQRHYKAQKGEKV